MDISQLALSFNHWLMTTFNKEGIFIFTLSCLMFFALASCLAKWAWDSGQFKDLEFSKFEMLED